MKSPALAALLALAPLLGGCQDRQVRADNEALRARVAALEAQMKALQAQQQDEPDVDAQAVTERAAAQNCANTLARSLETFRQGSADGDYPTPTELTLPDACAGQRVTWPTLEAGAYTFVIVGPDGQELARQSGN